MHSQGSYKVVHLVWLRWGAAFMITGIILGAFGAHALREVLDPRSLEAWKTGVMYQLLHGLALIALGGMAAHQLRSQWVLRFMVVGVILFSGSIYLLSAAGEYLPELARRILGPSTPIGGLCLITAWSLFLTRLFNFKVSD